MEEAKRHVRKQQLHEAVWNAETIEDLKEILAYLVGKLNV